MMRGLSTAAGPDRGARLLRDLLDRVRRLENKRVVPTGWTLSQDGDGRLIATNADGFSAVLADPTEGDTDG